MNRHSEQRLTKVHPELARRVRLLVERLASRGIVVEIVQGLRTYAEQDALFAQGRTTPGKIVTRARGGQSNHNFGLAVDLCPFENGLPMWKASPAVWQQIGNETEKLGLEWGGNWKFVDLPHAQLSVMSVAQCRELYKRGGLPLVWQRASAAVVAVEGVELRHEPTQQAQRDLPPFPVAWSVTVPELSPAPMLPAASRDSRKAVYTVTAGALAQVWASVLGWWQGLDVRWIYGGLMIGLTLLALAYLYRQTALGKIRETK